MSLNLSEYLEPNDNSIPDSSIIKTLFNQPLHRENMFSSQMCQMRNAISNNMREYIQLFDDGLPYEGFFLDKEHYVDAHWAKLEQTDSDFAEKNQEFEGDKPVKLKSHFLKGVKPLFKEQLTFNPLSEGGDADSE